MYKVLKHTCLTFELFGMNTTPVRRVTPPWDVYMGNSHSGWQVYPTWQTGQPALLPHLSCKRDQDLIRDHMERRVTSPTWGPPPPCKQALNLRSEQGPKYDTLSSTGLRHSMEWWSGGMAEYSTTRNALLCETKISQKWNCNEMRKLFIINRQIWILKER